MMVYVEVSKNHNIPIGDVIRRKFAPDMQLLIRYYNHQFRMRAKENEELEEKYEKMNE